MMIRTILTTFLLTWSTLHLHAQMAAAPSWAAKAQKSIVSVIAYDKDHQMLHSGTGFYISSDGIAIADYAIFNGAYDAIVVDINGNQNKVDRILGADDTYALVRFKVDTKKAVPLTLASLSTTTGAMTFALKFTKEKLQNCPSATVSENKPVADGCPYYTLSYAFDSDYIGSPLFNANGQLVGTVQPSLGMNGYALGSKFFESLTIQPLTSKAGMLTLDNIHIRKGLPDSAEESLVYLYLKSRTADNDEYLDLLNLFVATYPDNAQGYYRRSTPLTDLQRFDEAERDLQMYYKLSEDKAEANSKIADVIYTKLVYQPTPAYDKWNYDVAIDYIDKALASHPSSLDYQLLKSQILMSKKDYTAALAMYDNINQGEFRSPATLYAASLAHDGLGHDASLQIELLDSALAMFGTPLPAEAANYIMRRGRLYATEGKFREAVSDYNQYCFLCNNSVSDIFYYDRAMLEVDGRMYQQALDDIDKAISMNPRPALYWVEKCAIQLRVGQVTESMESARQALWLDSSLSDAYRMLGYAQIQQGDKANGRKNLEKAVELGDEGAKELLEKTAQ